MKLMDIYHRLFESIGNPVQYVNSKIWYHGSKNKTLTFGNPKTGVKRKSNMQLDFGTHFSSKEYADFYADGGKLYKVRLNVRKPLDLTKAVWNHDDAEFEDIYELIKKLKLEKAYGAISKHDINGDDFDGIGMVALTANMLNRIASKKVYDTLISSGYDSIIYEPYHPTGLRYFIKQDISIIILKRECIKEII